MHWYALFARKVKDEPKHFSEAYYKNNFGASFLNYYVRSVREK